MAASAEEAAKQALAPYPTLLQHKFPHLKITLFDIHPVKPWILFAEKDTKKGHIFLYDYEQNDVLHSFAVHTLFEQRKEEMQLLRILEKNYNGITLPGMIFQKKLLIFFKIGTFQNYYCCNKTLQPKVPLIQQPLQQQTQQKQKRP